ncbi:segregation and condensation protein A [Fimbriimonas ginsengisoli Gsoil 348]|uniref:Segregation and condensation protein A n=1 Tax=Fimbriimonas ginsengisoli Gsoil 348 TaxID=661478 RepID=A0A068NYH1_FIMGI|nr:segregation and condensation protein A [Fimbriimonas ginsengisoli Gsoil 348]
MLPVPDPEPDYEEAMDPVEPTSHEYRAAIEALSMWQQERDRLFFRSPDVGPDPYELPYTLSNVSPTDLARAFERLLKKAQPEQMEHLSKPRKSLADQMEVVLLAISFEWRSLEQLVVEPFTRSDAVYWFLALLELIRLGQVRARLNEDGVEFARA